MGFSFAATTENVAYFDEIFAHVSRRWAFGTKYTV